MNAKHTSNRAFTWSNGRWYRCSSKIANNYDIESHLKLQEEALSLVPKIIANSVLDDQYQIVLMEFWVILMTHYSMS